MKQIKKNYTAAFKAKAVTLSYERENIKELAIELGVDVQRIYKWRTAAKSIEIPVKSGRGKSATNVNGEDKRLQKELKEAKLELEILKKAVHIFSRNDGKSTSL